MAGFDAEIRMSLRQIEATLAAVQTKNDSANRSLRQTVAELKMVAAGHREAATAAGTHAAASHGVSEKLHGVGKGAAFAGGHAGHLLHGLLRLGSFNPVGIAVGLGIGFIADKAMEAAHAVGAMKHQLDDLAGAAQGRQDAAVDKVIMGADARGVAKRVFGEGRGEDAFTDVPEEFRGQAKEAARMAVLSGSAATEEEAVERMTKGGAFHKRASAFGPAIPLGTDAMAAIAAGSDSADFASDFRRTAGTAAGQASIFATQQQLGQKEIDAAANAIAVREAGGQGGSLTASENIVRAIREQTEIMKREQDRSWFGATSTIEAAASARVSELEREQASILTQIDVSHR